MRTAAARMSMLALIAGLALTTPAAPAPEKAPEKKGETYTDPAAAGADYKIQGEYKGTAGGKPIGCQVIALGDGTFRAVFEAGGLPGDGWDGTSRAEAEGKANGAKATFTGGGYTAVVADDALTGKAEDGSPVELKKVSRTSPAEGAKPPAGAIVLFDGTNTDAWDAKAKIDGRKLLGAGATTKQLFTDFTLHVEFLLPFKPHARSQERGNSGIYIQKHYEIQVLDSFGLKPQFNDCASLYRAVPPLVNMCYPPLTWQTYDIDFTAARYDAAGKRVADAVVTVKHNGVVVQDKTPIKGPTGAGAKEDPKQQVQSGPIYLQDHGNPVFFRNVWIVDRGSK